MRRFQIIDLDGCIADDRWRRDLVGSDPSGDRWHAYHLGALHDKAANLHELTAEHIIIFTARPMRYRVDTERWLRDVACVRYLHLLMRNDNDHCPTILLKQRMLRGLLDANSYAIHREHIIEAIDDLDDIVQMYRDEGIPARVVRIGEEQWVVPPKT